jgi:hypothetical protein
MTAVLFYPQCTDFSYSQDGFWIRCPSVELEEKVLPYLSQEDHKRLIEGRQHFLSTSWAKSNPDLLVKPDSFYFLASRDGKEILHTDPFFP